MKFIYHRSDDQTSITKKSIGETVYGIRAHKIELTLDELRYLMAHPKYTAHVLQVQAQSPVSAMEEMEQQPAKMHS